MINLKLFNPETIKNAALSLLKQVAARIIKFKTLGRGQTPWVYYEGKDGKKRSTFLKKSDFSGYSWNNELTEVVNLETGDIYKVNRNSCTCSDWHYRVRSGKKDKCKHQQMWEQLTAFKLNKELEIEESELPTGCFTRKNNNECSLYAWTKEFNGEEYYPTAKEIGRIIKPNHSAFIEAWTNTAITGIDFDSVADAINYLIKQARINLKECKEAYLTYEYAF
jgi:predicted nucleic acid-binding Zn finger protein